MNAITFTVPIRTSNPLNGSHQHWSAKSRKRKAERAAVARVVRIGFDTSRFAPSGIPLATSLGRVAAAGPVSVRLIRTKPRGGPLDFDGLTAALKSVRDGVALALGIDDGDTARVRFDYAEERGEWGVRVEVKEREASGDLPNPCPKCRPDEPCFPHFTAMLAPREEPREMVQPTSKEANQAAEARIIAAAAKEGHHIPVENLRAFVEDIAQRADRANAKRAGAKVQPKPATYRPGAR